MRPKAGLSWGEGAGEDVPANEPPLGPGAPVPLCMCPPFRDPAGPSYSETKPSAPKGWWSLWAGRALKSPLGSTSPGGGGVPTSSLLP